MADKVSSTLVQNLETIKKTKNDIKNSLVKFGLNLNGKTFEDYPGVIDSISLAPYTPEGTPVAPGTFGKNGKNVQLTTGNTMYYNGDFKANKVINAVWNDYAEFFKSEGTWEYGDIIELNPETGNYRRAISEDSVLVVGVASDSYGSIVGGEFNTIEENLENYIPIGLMGRVNVKIKGQIKVGDLISMSNEPGIGKKSDGKIGTVVGKALASSSAEYNTIPMLIVRG